MAAATILLLQLSSFPQRAKLLRHWWENCSNWHRHFPREEEKEMGGNSSPLGFHHRQMAVLIQLSNHPAFKKLVSHHTCHSSNSQRKTSSPGWAHWIKTSKHLKVQESRVRSGRRKGFCKAQSCYQPPHRMYPKSRGNSNPYQNPTKHPTWPQQQHFKGEYDHAGIRRSWNQE